MGRTDDAKKGAAAASAINARTNNTLEENARLAAGIGQPTPDTPGAGGKTASGKTASTSQAVSGGAITPLHTEYGDTAPRVEVADKSSDLSDVKTETENNQQQGIADLGDKIKELENGRTARLKELTETSFVDQKEADDRVRYAERVGQGLWARYKNGEFDKSDDPTAAKRTFGTLLADHIGTGLQNLGAALGLRESTKKSDFENMKDSDLDAALERRKVADNMSLSKYLKDTEYAGEQKREMEKTNSELMRNEEIRPILNRLNNADKTQLFALDAEFGNVLVNHPELVALFARAQKSGDKDFIKQQLAEQNAHDFSIALMEKGVDISAEQAKALADVQLMTAKQRGEWMASPEAKEIMNKVAIYNQYESGKSTANQNLERANQAVGVGNGVMNFFGSLFGFGGAK